MRCVTSQDTHIQCEFMLLYAVCIMTILGCIDIVTVSRNCEHITADNDDPEQGKELVPFLVRAQLDFHMILPWFKTEIITLY